MKMGQEERLRGHWERSRGIGSHTVSAGHGGGIGWGALLLQTGAVRWKASRGRGMRGHLLRWTSCSPGCLEFLTRLLLLPKWAPPGPAFCVQSSSSDHGSGKHLHRVCSHAQWTTEGSIEQSPMGAEQLRGRARAICQPHHHLCQDLSLAFRGLSSSEKSTINKQMQLNLPKWSFLVRTVLLEGKLAVNGALWKGGQLEGSIGVIYCCVVNYLRTMLRLWAFAIARVCGSVQQQPRPCSLSSDVRDARGPIIIWRLHWAATLLPMRLLKQPSALGTCWAPQWPYHMADWVTGTIIICFAWLSADNTAQERSWGSASWDHRGSGSLVENATVSIWNTWIWGFLSKWLHRSIRREES